ADPAERYAALRAIGRVDAGEGVVAAAAVRLARYASLTHAEPNNEQEEEQNPDNPRTPLRPVIHQERPQVQRILLHPFDVESVIVAEQDGAHFATAGERERGGRVYDRLYRHRGQNTGLER